MGKFRDRVSAALSVLKGKDPRVVYSQSVTYANLWSPSNEPQADAGPIAQMDTTNPVLYSCVQRIAEDAAGTPLKMVQTDAKGMTTDVKEHPALDLLTKHINLVDNPFTFWCQLFADLLIEGNSFSWLVLEAGQPRDMLRLKPELVIVNPDAKILIGSYRWRAPGGEDQIYKPEEILHFKTRNPDSYLRGLGVAYRLRDYMILEREMLAYQQRRFANDLTPEIIVTTTAKMASKEERDRVAEAMDARFNGRRNGGKRWAVLEDGVYNFTVIPRATETEIAYMASMNWLRNIYAMAFGVPPNKMGDWNDASGLSTNAGEQDRLYWEDTIQQWHRLVLDNLNSTFMQRYYPADLAKGVRWAYDYSQVKALNSSAKEQTDIWSKRITGALSTPNEAREAMGAEAYADEAADKLYLGTRELGAAEEAAAAQLAAAESVAQGTPPGDGKKPPKKPGDGKKPPPKEPGKVLQLVKTRTDGIFDMREERQMLADAVRATIRTLVAQAAQQQLDVDGIVARFNERDPVMLSFVERQVMRMGEEVPGVTREMVREAVAHGMSEGLPIAEMRRLVQDAFKARRKDWQLDRIARTEVHNAQEGGGWMSAKQAGVEFKVWLTARDGRVRGLNEKDHADHAGLEDVVMPLDEPFVDPRDGAQLMYPGDRDGKRATGADTINCRCTWAADFRHLDLEKAAKLISFEERAQNTWEAKAAFRDRGELALRRILRAYLRGMEQRTLARFDAQNGGLYAAVS